MKKVVGVIPAAGNGTRLFPYNAGKELLPVGSQYININGKPEERPKIVSQYIIEAMVEAGVERIIIIINPAKDGLMGLHLDGKLYGVSISYIVQNPPSMAHSIDLAYEWIKSSTVILGMPDTIVLPSSSVKQLMEKHSSSDSELTLGLFRTKNHKKFGMVKIDSESNILYHQDKPVQTDAKLMWGLAVWEPSFTETLHDYVRENESPNSEMTLGDVYDLVINQNRKCKGYPITDGKYYDIGTYQDYKRAILEV